LEYGQVGSVFANSKRVSGKKTPNKSAPAMMSVCLSPPSPPAGPIPVPYPVADTASHTADGTGSVQIEKKEVGKKNSSTYSKCSGNQPATRSFGMDIVSHVIEGSTRFQAYSFDVLFEKGGADRFMDLTTSNHSNTGTATTMSAADAATAEAQAASCKALRAEVGRMRNASNEASARDRSFSREQERSQGALTASQSADSGIQRRTSNYSNAQACMRADPPMPVARKTGVQGPGAGTSSNVCGGGTPYANMELKNHTEAQMLENINWNKKPQWVAFATDWSGYDRDTGRYNPDLQNGPCRDCQKKLDEACACGLTIIICDSEGNPRNYCKKSK
jgi:hypothetical protein